MATLNFSVTNTSPAVSPSAPGGAKPKRLQIAQIFAADNQRGITANTWSVNGVFLIDGVHAKKYLVAQDAQGNCACSSSLISTYADVGQPVLLSATFAAPPADVTSVDVYVPNAGTFAGVPIS